MIHAQHQILIEKHVTSVKVCSLLHGAGDQHPWAHPEKYIEAFLLQSFRRIFFNSMT